MRHVAEDKNILWLVETFLMTIRAKFYGIPSRNKKVACFDSKLAFFGNSFINVNQIRIRLCLSI